MTKENYPDFVHSLFVKPGRHVERMVHASLGICTEAGEIGTTIKAHWIYGKDLDHENIREEIGDLLFYVQALCNEVGWSMEDCMTANVEKLNKRYPDGYTDRAAIERIDKQ